MIPVIIATVSFVTVIAVTSLIVVKGADMKKQYDNQLRRMTDQINNTNYYNSQIDKRNIEDIRDVRTNYATKDQIARRVDTRHLTSTRADAKDIDADLVMSEYMRAGKLAVDTVSAEKIISASGIVGNLDVANANASRVSLVTGKDPGVLRFDSSGGYYMNRKDNALVVGVPDGSQFRLDGKSPIIFDPAKGSMDAATANIGSVNLIAGENAGVLNFDRSAQYNMQKKDNNMIMGMPKSSQFKFDGEMPITFDPTQGQVLANHAKFDQLHASRGDLGTVNLIAGENAGVLNFDKSLEYNMQRKDNDMILGMPKSSQFKLDGEMPITFDPTHGRMVANKAQIGTIDLIAGENAGVLNFDQSGNYHMKKQDGKLSVGMPSQTAFTLEGDKPVKIDPTQGSIGFNNKFSIGEANLDYGGDPVKSLSMAFDNKDILRAYDWGDYRFSTLNSELYLTSGDGNYSYLSMSGNGSDDIILQTSPGWKGISTSGSKPFNLYSQSTINANRMNISGIGFNTVPPTSGTNPSIINDTNQLSIFGKGNLGSKNVNLNDNVFAMRFQASPSYMSQTEIQAPKVIGEYEVRSGSAFLKADGNISGTKLCLGARCADNTNFQAEGPIGPTGATGPIGVTGATGATGPTGPQIVSLKNVVEFGHGTSGKEINAGKMGYTTFSTDALDIVGAGGPGISRNVKVHDKLTVRDQICFEDPSLPTAPPLCITRPKLSANFMFYAINGATHNNPTGLVTFPSVEFAVSSTLPAGNSAFQVKVAGLYQFNVTLNMEAGSSGVWKAGIHKSILPPQNFAPFFPSTTDIGWITILPDSMASPKYSVNMSIIARCNVNDYVRVLAQITPVNTVGVKYATGNNKMCSFSGQLISP